MAEFDTNDDGAFTPSPSRLPPPVNAQVVAEVTLANGNLVTFYEFDDGSVAVGEDGQANTNAIGTLPELHEATALEIFEAVAPADATPPAALRTNHELVRQRRAADGVASPVPAGFRVAELNGFYDPLQPYYFNTCTNNADWRQHVGSSPIGANCPGSAGKDWYACWADWALPLSDDCDSEPCTRTFTSGHNQLRASVCARSGTGAIDFAMGQRVHGTSSWSTWFDKTLFAGGYYNYWYNSSTEKDFWHTLFRTGTKHVNWSLWLD